VRRPGAPETGVRGRAARALGLAASGALALLVLGALPAAAHVTVSPSVIAQGTDDVILTFRVPNESPTPIVLLNPEAGSGWQVRVVMAALPKPVTTDDGTFTSTVSEIDWTGGTIPVGQFGQFNVLAQGIPTGTSQLVFKAIQSYSDGTVVSWIQVPTRAVPNPEHPAPTITLTAPGPQGAATPTTTAPAAAAGGSATVTASSGNDWQSVAALILAAFAAVLAVLAVWLGRPRLGARSPSGDEPVGGNAQPGPETSSGAAG